MTLELVSPSQNKKIEIVLRDMAGENRKDLFLDDFPNIDKRLEAILDTAPIDGTDYGLLTPVLFANMYLIVVNCSKFKDDYEIRKEESYIKETIRRLWEIKNRMGELTDGMIHVPFTLAFTKYDQLPSDKQKYPEELMNELPEVTAALKRYHNEEKKYFKTSIQTIPISDSEIQNIIIKKRGSAKKSLDDAETDQKSLVTTKEEIKKELDETNELLSNLTRELNEKIMPTGVEADIENIKNEISDAIKDRDLSKEEYDEITGELDHARQKMTHISQELSKTLSMTVESADISKHNPTKPLEYSIDDYLQLIDWIVIMHNSRWKSKVKLFDFCGF